MHIANIKKDRKALNRNKRIKLVNKLITKNSRGR